MPSLSALKFPYQISEDIAVNQLGEADVRVFLEAVDEDRDYLRSTVPWVDDRTNHDNIAAYFDRVDAMIEKNKGFCAGIFHQDEFAGEIKVHNIDWDNQKAEIGYWLRESKRGLGLATEATSWAANLLLNEVGLKRVYLTCEVDNRPSQGVAERAGFVCEGILRKECIRSGKPIDLVMYSRVDDSDEHPVSAADLVGTWKLNSFIAETPDHQEEWNKTGSVVFSPDGYFSLAVNASENLMDTNRKALSSRVYRDYFGAGPYIVSPDDEVELRYANHSIPERVGFVDKRKITLNGRKMTDVGHRGDLTIRIEWERC